MMYDELIYHLDLCILSYQLHAQTLIWPTDPYYEQLLYHILLGLKTDAIAEDRRKAFVTHVEKKFRLPMSPSNQQARFHGPGYCVSGPVAGPIHAKGWDTNPFLDPIISDYSRINPWRPSFTRPFRHREPWVMYDSPAEITNPIDKVHMIQFDTQKGPNLQVSDIYKQTLFTTRPPNVAQVAPNVRATDVLYAFEGGTGAVGGDTTAKKYPSWSMMGFVLARRVSHAEMYPNSTKPAPRTAPPEPYDVHIVFRGSRSGDPRIATAMNKAKGNPDWVTDLQLLSVIQDLEVSKFGSVCKGFSASLKSMLPTVIASLVDIHRTFQAPPTPPRTIYVTGHSLGGALASLFASAIMLGTKYGPTGMGDAMPDELRAWPWRGMQLISFASPVVGGKEFHEAFDKTLASRRVWLEGDPITQERRNYAVGIPYRIPLLLAGAPGARGHRQEARLTSHQPMEIRKELIDHRRKHDFPVTNVPTAEPWRVFETCYEMLQYIGILAGAGNFDRQECFPRFTEHLQTYFQILHDSIGNAGVSGQLKAFDVELGKLNLQASKKEYTDLEQLWVNSAGAIKSFDANLYRYLGLCLALAFYSQSGDTRYTTGPFADLLKTI